jgi:ATP-dependent RNA helicase RhlE
VDAVSQKVYFIDRGEKLQLLTFLLTQKDAVRSLVFARTKHGADRIARNLARFRIRAAAIHGDKTQSKRQRALDAFKRGEVKVLVATDVASRGLDIDDVSHVFNFDVPNEPESYVHRIGRTGRAGAGGVAITLCSPDERILFRDVEKLINKKD